MLKLMKNTFIGIIKKMILQTFKHDTKSAKKKFKHNIPLVYYDNKI